jgi:diaminohydroxyphosphoribosylaminopyrimidine deaminase/5-amino-6-(5-phosphoribosylamino)uracil reductase
MVGCVLTRDGEVIGKRWHRRFGGLHAEVEAIEDAGGKEAVRDAVAYVTLEPCCIHGKTPPCTGELIDAGVVRVVAGCSDPNPDVAGRGFQLLADAGVDVVVGVMQREAEQLIAPFHKLQTERRPWVLAKWAMTLDGKIAAHDGTSKWISGEASRKVVQRLRGRMDAIMVGRRTAQLDDPLLTARLAGARVTARIVLDSEGQLSPQSRLVQSIQDAPVVLATGPMAPAYRLEALESRGVEVLRFSSPSRQERLTQLLNELGRRGATNVLCEGGGEMLGSLLAGGQIDEVHAFVAPKLLGGEASSSPLAEAGFRSIGDAVLLRGLATERLGDDIYIHGRIIHGETLQQSTRVTRPKS